MNETFVKDKQAYYNPSRLKRDNVYPVWKEDA